MDHDTRSTAPTGRVSRLLAAVRSVPSRQPLACVLLLAFGLRLLVALEIPLDPRSGNLLDASWYDRQAQQLLKGQGYVGRDGSPTAMWPPGYPFLLAVVYRIAGTAVLHAKLLNVLLATATCWLTFAIGRRAYSRSIGLLAAAFVAASLGDVFYAPITMSEVAFQFAFTGLVWLFLVLDEGAVGIAAARWLLLGVCTGAAALIRGPGIFFLPVPIAAWWFNSVPRGRVFIRGLICVAGVALVLAPWAIRNQRAFGIPILISLNGSWVLFDSHSPVASGEHTRRAGKYRKSQFKELDSLPREQRLAERSKAEIRAAIEYALSHPVEELILAPQRLYHLFARDDFAVRFSQQAFEQPDRSYSRETSARFTLLAQVANTYFVVLAVLALLGMTRVWTRACRHALAIPFAVLVFVLMHAFVFIGGPRFHVPFLPLLAILAAIAIDGRRRPWPIDALPDRPRESSAPAR